MQALLAGLCDTPIMSLQRTIRNTILATGIVVAAGLGLFLFEGEVLIAIFLGVPSISVMGSTALAEPRSVCGSKALVRLSWPHRHTGFLLRFCSEVEASSHSPGKRGRLS
jgi:hypothetical protein